MAIWIGNTDSCRIIVGIGCGSHFCPFDTSMTVPVQSVSSCRQFERKNSRMCDTDLFKSATTNTFCDNSRMNFVNRS